MGFAVVASQVNFRYSPRGQGNFNVIEEYDGDIVALSVFLDQVCAIHTS